MKDYLRALPEEIQEILRIAADTALKLGMHAYLVGGQVRDLILGVKNFDLDIVIDGDGIGFSEVFASRLKAKLIRHRRFGTATVLVAHKLKIDIATARKESYPKPAHLPEVTPGSLRDDLLRRDFTINAMAITITGDDFGKIIDIFDGRRDLLKRSIRILHDLSFIDDPTRILRAIRFEQRFRFRIEPHTLKLLRQACCLKMLEKVQPQRLRDELILILKEPRILPQLRRIQALSGFSFISPKLSLRDKGYHFLRSAQKGIDWFKRQYHQRRVLDTWLIFLMGLADPLTPAELRSVCKRLVFTKGEEKRLLNSKLLVPRIARQLSKKGITPPRIFSLLEPLSYEEIIFMKAKYINALIQERIRDFFQIYNGMRLYVGGDDLRNLGLIPGPYYKKIFTLVLHAKLNGLIKTREEELEMIRGLIRKK